MRRRELKYLIIILILVLAYWAAPWLIPKIVPSFAIDPPALSTRITTTTALIAAVTFWLQLKRTENLNEANFIMNMNNQFISNRDFTAVEHELELYYNRVVAIEAQASITGIAPTLESFERIELGLQMDRENPEYQRLINYLVYMEALAAIVQRDVMHLGVIDDLFAYRFFIAVNNPIVQKYELLPYADYYRGCFKLSEMWTDAWEKQGIKPPLAKTLLHKCDKSKWNKPVEYDGGNVKIRPARVTDDMQTIARCLYLTDPYIYPGAFGADEAFALKALTELVKMEGSLFHYRNIWLACEGETVCGLVLLNNGSAKWEEDKSAAAVTAHIPDAEAFAFASEAYFSQVAKQPPEDQIDIVACCVLPEHRRKGIARKLLSAVLDAYSDKHVTLDVLADNASAISLYKSCGFVTESRQKGFSLDVQNRPDCLHMRKKTERK